MNNPKFDQSELVCDVLSLREDFRLSGPDVSEMQQIDDYNLEDYRWLLVDQLQGGERIVAQWQDQTWIGVQEAA